MSATAQFLGSNIFALYKMQEKDSFLYGKHNAAHGTLFLLGLTECHSLIAGHWVSFTGL